MPLKDAVSALTLLAMASCRRAPALESTSGRDSRPPSAAATSPLPSRWVGVSLEKGRIAVSVTEVGEKPRRAVLEPPVPGRRPGAIEITDVAYDTRREQIYVATCCEPGSGLLWRIEWPSRPDFLADDQGFAVDVAGQPSLLARTDTFGTLGLQPAAGGEQALRTDAGVVDVAVDGVGPTRVVALVDSRRLRALVPTVSWHEPALLVAEATAAGGWAEARYPLPAGTTFCRAVALRSAAVGLLAGAFDPADPLECTGDRLDVYEPGPQRLQSGALRFPGRVRHLSVDESATFLIFTTVDGAVGWQTLDGRGGALAPRGFLAADW